MAELGLLRDHQGDEEMALRCRAPPKGRGEPECTPGGVSGPREDAPDGDSGGVARQGTNVASFPGGGGGALHHRCGCKQLSPPRPHPLALPPAEPATAAAPAPAQATTAVTAAPHRPRRWPRGGGQGTMTQDAPPQRSRAPRPTPRPPYNAAEGRMPPPVGGRTGAPSVRRGLLPRSPLTADH